MDRHSLSLLQINLRVYTLYRIRIENGGKTSRLRQMRYSYRLDTYDEIQ